MAADDPVLYGPDNKPIPKVGSTSKTTPEPTKQRKSGKKEQKTKTRISPMAGALGAATLIGGVAALLALLPRVTPSVSDPYDSNDPFSSLVTITNTGYLPLSLVEAFIGLNKLHLRDPQKGPTYEVFGANPGTPPYARFSSPKWTAHYLGFDDRFTFLMNDVIGPGWGEGNLAIIVDYRIPLIQLKREKIFPLISKRRTNGTFYWAFGTEAN